MCQWIRNIFCTLCAMTLALPAEGQNMRTIFTSLPSQVVPQFSADQRVALLEAYDQKEIGGSIYITNNFGSKSRIVDLAPDFIYLQLDDEVTLQIKSLEDEDGNALTSLVFTSTTVPQLSVLLFYDLQWQRQATEDFFCRPSQVDFLRDLKQGESNEVKAMLNAVGPFSLKYEWDASRQELLVENTTFENPVMGSLYPKADQWISKKILRYKWYNGKLLRL